ncbi:hypothetical protein JG688_00011729 [Phytophthora aleatoria]|uniref:Uncharacterized protein n=1 Tax=Phytophthora aleatoria TaxID=2496075 RepID=A0A8J5IC51_9STRA|nr:hypothetical protein JG688_00011729 [Phytophthora aleatoria]
MDLVVVDELTSSLYEPDDLTLPATLILEDVNLDSLLGEMETLLNSTDSMMPPAALTWDAGASRFADNSHGAELKTKTKQLPQISSDAVRCSMYRKRRKLEKDGLLREINDLSSKLDKLRKIATSPVVRDSTGPMRVSSLWKALATQEKEKKQDAEEEHLQLRAAITQWTNAIEDLRDFLKKGVNDELTASKDGCVDEFRKRKKLFKATGSYTASWSS